MRVREADAAPRREAVAVGALALGALSTLFLPAGRFRAGQRNGDIRLVELVGVGYLLIGSLLLFGCVGAYNVWRGRTCRFAMWGFSALAAGTLLWIVLAESLVLLIPSGIMPTSLRRATLGLGARPGAWLALPLLAGAAIASVGRFEAIVRHVGRGRNETPRDLAWRIATVASLAAGLVLFVVGRNGSLLRIEAASRTVDVSLWGIPYLGPLSLVVVIAFAAATVAVLLRFRITAVALVAAGFGTLAATVLTGLIFASNLADRGWLTDLTAKILDSEGPVEIISTTTRPGGTIALCACLLVVGTGAVAIARDRQPL